MTFLHLLLFHSCWASGSTFGFILQKIPLQEKILKDAAVLDNPGKRVKCQLNQVCFVLICQVTVGNLALKLGQLKYQKLDWLQPDTDDQWVVVTVAAACGGTLVTLILIIVAVYKRKSSRAERQFTKLQVQLDALESNIRHECKQGRLPSNYIAVVTHSTC